MDPKNYDITLKHKIGIVSVPLEGRWEGRDYIVFVTIPYASIDDDWRLDALYVFGEGVLACDCPWPHTKDWTPEYEEKLDYAMEGGTPARRSQNGYGEDTVQRFRIAFQQFIDMTRVNVANTQRLEIVCERIFNKQATPDEIAEVRALFSPTSFEALKLNGEVAHAELMRLNDEVTEDMTELLRKFEQWAEDKK